MRELQKLSKELGGACMNPAVKAAEEKVDNWINNHVVDVN